jgi:hypothetical protein
MAQGHLLSAGASTTNGLRRTRPSSLVPCTQQDYFTKLGRLLVEKDSAELRALAEEIYIHIVENELHDSYDEQTQYAPDSTFASFALFLSHASLSAISRDLFFSSLSELVDDELQYFLNYPPSLSLDRQLQAFIQVPPH